MKKISIREEIERLEKRYGSLRAVARELEINHVYLHRLKYGEKNNPSDDILRKLGLYKIVSSITYYRILESAAK